MARTKRRENRRARSDERKRLAAAEMPATLESEQRARDMVTALHKRSNAFRRHAAHDLAIRQITNEIENTNRKMQVEVLRFAEAYALVTTRGLEPSQAEAADAALVAWERLLSDFESMHDRLIPLLRQRADHGVVAINKETLERGIVTSRTRLLEIREQLDLNITRMNAVHRTGS